MASERDRIRLSDEEVAAFLAARRTLHVATINRDGSPHLVPMWFLLSGGAVTFWSYTKSQKIRNLERDPRVTVMAEDGDDYFELRGVQISGRAHLSTDRPELIALGEALFERYRGPLDDVGRGFVARQAAKRTRVTVEPLRVISWDHRRLAGPLTPESSPRP